MHINLQYKIDSSMSSLAVEDGQLLASFQMFELTVGGELLALQSVTSVVLRRMDLLLAAHD